MAPGFVADGVAPGPDEEARGVGMAVAEPVAVAVGIGVGVAVAIVVVVAVSDCVADWLGQDAPVPAVCGVQYRATTSAASTITTAALARPIGMPPRCGISLGATAGWYALSVMALHSLQIRSYRDSLIWRLQASRGHG